MKTKFFVDSPLRSSPYFNEKVEIRESSIHGLGVFAKELIKKSEIFECCPVIAYDQYTMTYLHEMKNCRHLLHDYVFTWYSGQCALALGYGGIYNHSNDHANASHRMTKEPVGIQFVAKRDIHPGEEILIHYWKGKIRGEFTSTGTMVEDGRVSDDMLRQRTTITKRGYPVYRKKRKK